MPVLHIRIDATIDGDPVRGFPKSRFVSLDETQEGDYDEAADNDDTTFSAIPVGQVGSVEAFILDVVNAVGVRLEGGEATNVAIRFNAGGGMIAWGLTGITGTNMTVNVNSASVARLKFLAGGT